MRIRQFTETLSSFWGYWFRLQFYGPEYPCLLAQGVVLHSREVMCVRTFSGVQEGDYRGKRGY